MAPSKRKKGEGKRLNDEERLEIINMLENPNCSSMRSIARHVGVGEKTIRNIKSNMVAIKAHIVETNDAQRKETKRISLGRFHELEQCLIDWLKALRIAGLIITPSMLKHKARSIAVAQNIPESDFKCSNGWYHRFKKRWNITGTCLYGEAGEVDKDDPVILEQLRELETLIVTYDIDNIYNMDETGLFYRLIPRYTLLMPTEDVKTVRGQKTKKDRVTLAVCCNATGTHKIPLQIIGKPAKPACIVGREWPVPYSNQKNAWMDTATFMKWFDKIFYPEVTRRTGLLVLLLLDNAPGHCREFVRNNVTVKFFPPNVTSWKQPMDMGIIAALKKQYKYILLKEIIGFHDLPTESKQQRADRAQRMRRGSAGVFYGKPATLLDAAKFSKEAWDAITPNTLMACFRKAEIIVSLDGADAVVPDEGIDELYALLQNCSIRNELELSTIEEDIDYVLNADNEDAEDWNECILEEADEIVRSADHGLIVHSVVESVESDDDAEDENEQVEQVETLSVPSIISHVDAAINGLQNLGNNTSIPEKELLNSLESLSISQRKLQALNSAIVRAKNENSQQMTIHNCFKM